MIKLELKIETTNYKILQSKHYILSKFFNIYKIKNKHYILPRNRKRFALLRSPHIHKKTWKTYYLETYASKYTIIINKQILIKLYKLLVVFSAHSKFYFKFQQI